MEKKNKYLFISEFVIKIVALVTMTIDHIGATMQSFTPWNTTTINVFRSIGRLALPLFAFMIVEGVLHTKNIKKYFMRLGIMAGFVSAILCVFQYVNNKDLNSLATMGNIFLDLLVGAVMIYCLENKKISIKCLAIIPIAISLISFGAFAYENTPYNHVLWYPLFLRLQYSFYSTLLILLFYLVKKLTPLFLESFYHVEKDSFKDSDKLLIYENILSGFAIIVASLLYYSIYFINSNWVSWDYKCQNWAMLSGLILLFYNGKRGFNKKWFQFATYLYYPVHIIIIIGIFILIYGY